MSRLTASVSARFLRDKYRVPAALARPRSYGVGPDFKAGFFELSGEAMI